MNKFFNELNYFKKYLDVAITIVAHPTKLEKRRRFDYIDSTTGASANVMWYAPPTGYDIFGGSEIYNQVDSILSLYRVPTELEGGIEYPYGYCQMYIQKMKLDYLGKLGASEFVFDAKTRQFTCIDNQQLSINPLQQQTEEFYDAPPF
jgi:hypothetical protein